MPNPEPGSLYVAWWGACLSTVLALVKLWELWRDRFQLEVSYNLRSDPSLGNEIYVRNLSGKPLILTHWELFHRSGRWPRRKLKFFAMADPDVGDTRVEPHTTHTLRFVDANHFSWSHGALNGRHICIQLHVAGRRPILRLVYSQ